MPNTRSAIKRLRTSQERHQRNMRRSSRLKEAKKTFQTQLDANDLAAAQETLNKCYSLLDRAAKHRTISKNKASRDKKRLASLLSSRQQAVG